MMISGSWKKDGSSSRYKSWGHIVTIVFVEDPAPGGYQAAAPVIVKTSKLAEHDQVAVIFLVETVVGDVVDVERSAEPAELTVVNLAVEDVADDQPVL